MPLFYHIERLQPPHKVRLSPFLMIILHVVGPLYGFPSILGIAELIVPIGAFFSCSNTCLIPHYRRVFPKSEDDPKKGTTPSVQKA